MFVVTGSDQTDMISMECHPVSLSQHGPALGLHMESPQQSLLHHVQAPQHSDSDSKKKQRKCFDINFFRNNFSKLV